MRRAEGVSRREVPAAGDDRAGGWPPLPVGEPAMADLVSIIERLDQLIAAMRQSSMSDVWLDASGVAAILSYEVRYVAENVALRRDFLRPMHLDGKGHPTWKR